MREPRIRATKLVHNFGVRSLKGIPSAVHEVLAFGNLTGTVSVNSADRARRTFWSTLGSFLDPA